MCSIVAISDDLLGCLRAQVPSHTDVGLHVMHLLSSKTFSLAAKEIEAALNACCLRGPASLAQAVLCWRRSGCIPTLARLIMTQSNSTLRAEALNLGCWYVTPSATGAGQLLCCSPLYMCTNRCALDCHKSNKSHLSG